MKKRVVVDEQEVSKKSKVMVMKCHCESEYQDGVYGMFMRVHNLGKTRYRCTQCGDSKAA